MRSPALSHLGDESVIRLTQSCMLLFSVILRPVFVSDSRVSCLASCRSRFSRILTMDDIWKKAAKKLRAREHRAATCAATTFRVETDTTTAINNNPAVADIENTETVQITTPTTSNEIEAEIHAIERDWLDLGRGPLPEEYQVRIDEIRAREAAKLMKVEGDEREVVRERAGTEEISDQERERRRKRNERKRKMGKEDTKEVRTTTDTTGNDATYLAPSLFDWAEDVDATVTPTPITLVTPAVRAPHDFSVLRSSNRNPWGSLSRRHRRSQPCTRNSFYSCQYNTNYAHKPTPPPLPLAPIQLVETIRHPHGIAPTKPVIKTSSAVSTPMLHSSISTHLREPLSAVRSDSSLRPSYTPSLDWSGDPLLAGLARILEVLGWTREITARRGRRFV